MDCESILKENNEMLKVLLNEQGKNTADIVRIKEVVNNIINIQGENTALIVKTDSRVQKLFDMFGLKDD